MPAAGGEAKPSPRRCQRVVPGRQAKVRTGGNVAEAARRAGVDRGTVFRTLRRTGMRDEKDG